MKEKDKVREVNITFGKALGCIIGLVIVLALGFAIIGLDTKVTFLLASVVVGIFLVAYGYKLEQVMTWYIDGGKSSIELILILMSVGTVIGTWMASGTVPTIIYYGLKMLTPTSFMIIGFLLCCLVSFFVGSSYSTLATLGVAFVGIGTGLGMNLGLVAGMVLSGAMFGDKMSPFSDTTNLAPAVSGTTVYRHINSMIYTVTPTMIITFALYTILSMKFDTHSAEMTLVDEMIHGIEATYNVTPVLFIVPVFVLTLALFKVPPVVAMISSAFLAIIMGTITQQGHIDLLTLIDSMGVGFATETGVPELDSLINRGGIVSMMEVVAWTLLTLGMGHCLKEAGILGAFLEKLLVVVKKPKHLVILTLCSSLVTACLTASQYLAIMLPGMLLRDQYTKFRLDKRLLSRTLEDGGTMFSFLIPWDTAGIYTASVLGIATVTYAPYAFLLWINPLVAAFYAIIGFAQFKDEKLLEEDRKAQEAKETGAAEAAAEQPQEAPEEK